MRACGEWRAALATRGANTATAAATTTTTTTTATTTPNTPRADYDGENDMSVSIQDLEIQFETF
jgi:hypothetical protein